VTAPKLLVTNVKAYRDLSFARLWKVFGPILAIDTPSSLSEILSSSHGVILDVGPGCGHQLFRFSSPDGITVVYGAEPSTSMHRQLRQRAQKVGLGDKYKIMDCGAELESLVPALYKEGLLDKDGGLSSGIFDEIVCIRVLCGVDDVTATVDGLYKCLKPGGRFVVCEHVVCRKTTGEFFQRLYGLLGWSFWAGGCQLRRDTTRVLRDVAKMDGGWRIDELQLIDERSSLPHIVGFCVKK
jgi:SAM-dependent methyltransferase